MLGVLLFGTLGRILTRVVEGCLYFFLITGAV